ncbi:hypothetical protein CK203_096921 [Vitis vinifera]|uniref:Reverse transcriptase domain-containing protein n=1 Tax=Vitis vinifera TaxID=29760 RepID=A0A438D022_VITVI|nr:hypothetical protein CK203_096921 [Vitis vinifera]
MKFKVGRGTKIMFWTDHWCGNEALSQAFPQIFALAVCSNELVNDVWDPRLGQGGWDLRLVRDSNDWELVLIEDLLFLLRDIRVTPEEDSVLWKGGDSVSFRIRVAYNLLAAPNPLVFPGKNIWVDKVPTKVAFLRGRLLGKKSSLVRTLWEIAFALFGVQWVFLEKGRGVLFTSRLLGVGSGPLRAGEVFLFMFFWPVAALYTSYLLAWLSGLYKLTAKMLAKRSKRVVGKSGSGSLICKLDIEKSYDHINWDFWLVVLGKMGFGQKWTEWHQRIEKGTRSAYLFVLAMEALSCHLEKAREGSLLLGFGVEGAIVGLKINLEKSELILIGEVANVQDLVLELCCRVREFPTYSRLPLGTLFRAEAVWDIMQGRFHGKTFVVEKIIYFERRKFDPSLKYLIQFAYLFHVFVWHVQKDSLLKEKPFGKGSFRESMERGGGLIFLRSEV